MQNDKIEKKVAEIKKLLDEGLSKIFVRLDRIDAILESCEKSGL